jgi:hypothetical protein
MQKELTRIVQPERERDRNCSRTKANERETHDFRGLHFVIYYSGDQIKCETGGTCSTREAERIIVGKETNK